ncbi:hypothetical protein Tco_0857101 [Tanacetum coccineum]|uniref:Reverse transcriptase domain-containing protein n=1 Tax=Tanacetum coccineum TaxID=301880 RepID=A0ABQ5BAX1_9ASTR
MSSYTHPSIPSDYDVEDAFSSTNAPNYIPTPPGYSPVTPGNISPDSSDDLTKDLLSSLSISPFHDDPYMKVIQAYDAIPPPQVIIALPAIVPPPMFDSRDFFPLEEISPPKDTETPVESPIPVSPSSSVRSSSPMPPKRTSTSAALAMTQAAIKKLVADSIAAALEAQAATMANTNRNTGTIRTPVARKGTNNHKRNFDDRRNITTNNDNNNYPIMITTTPMITTTTTLTIATTTTTKTITTVTTITTNSRIEGKKLSELMLPPQLRTKVSDLQQGGSFDQEVQKQKNSHKKQPAISKYLCDKSLVIPMKEIWLDDKLNVVEEPVEIMDREVKQLRRSCISIVKVRWNSEFTSEREDQIRAKYPHLFSNTTPSSN